MEALMGTRIRAALAAALVASAVSFGSVAADPGTKLLDANLTSIPAGAAALFPGVTGGGAPWVINRGDARLFADGRLQVEVDGLVLAGGPSIGTNPFPTGRAIVSCNNGADIVMTDLVPYSADGDAQVETQVDLPAPCLGAIVFFAGQTGGGPRWFAVSGG
jgi:hypothetical protein